MDPGSLRKRAQKDVSNSLAPSLSLAGTQKSKELLADRGGPVGPAARPLRSEGGGQGTVYSASFLSVQVV